MARSSIGIILYPEDIERIGRSVKPHVQFAVIAALSRYASDGVMPTEAELGEGGMVAFEFVRDKVDAALASYDKGRKQRQDAIRKRWNAEPCGTIRNDTEAYGSIRPYDSVPKTETETETYTETETEAEGGDARARDGAGGDVIGIDGTDLSGDIRANDTADAMILRYNLPRDLPTREKLLEDLSAQGEAVMREVLEEACASNTRERVTAKYWRAILQNRGKPKGARASPAMQGYLTGAAHRDEAHFKGLEVDLDALIESEMRK